ncbi:MAG: ABC transporter ATP-binding protein [Bacteroidetes bacterium]|nr:MAG: ABC transporter ATP-binding protein [Bacteroidota bacterium]
MISLHNLKKKYAGKTVLNIEQLQIEKGQCLGVVGNNGAGKTTMLSLMLDIIRASEGEVHSDGKPVAGSEHWKQYTTAYLNERFLIPFLSPMEFLEYVGKLHGKNKSDLEVFLEANSGFYQEDIKSRKYIRELSAGNKDKTGILATLLPDPQVLILDEPFAHLDPTSQSWLKTRLRHLHRQGTTIIVSSHDLKHVTEVCSRIVLLEEGVVIKDISATEDTLNQLEEYFKAKGVFAEKFENGR